jgi:plastocyanin
MGIPIRSRFLPLFVLVLATVLVSSTRSAADDRGDRSRHHKLVAVPDEDRFTPFTLTIRAGDTVDWINNDTDDHTVVSDDAVNTAGPRNIDHLIPGTDSNGGQPAPPFRLEFHDPGVWVYYCRFHSHLDEYNQPNAPGPDGGIQGEKDPTSCNPAGTDTCNFGTPMMGVITVLPHRHGDTGEAPERP